jgi:hypothetical protein
MAQAIRALPAPIPDPIAIENRHRWVEAANDDQARDRDNARPSARFRVMDQAADGLEDQPRAKSFRFQADPGAGRWEDGALSSFQASARAHWRTGTDAAQVTAGFDSFDGYSIGDPSRNAPPFLASLIAQSRLGQGLAYSAHGAASEAYRLSGARPPLPDGRPRLVSVVI